jgi:hypothetical protein
MPYRLFELNVDAKLLRGVISRMEEIQVPYAAALGVPADQFRGSS